MKKQLTVLFQQWKRSVEGCKNWKKSLEQIKELPELFLAKEVNKTAEGGQRPVTTTGDMKAPKTGDPGTEEVFSIC